ncbi:TPA: GIY-YIG nuclease family protein [Candidatus Bathyarchaeota archaeon]|nr:GIY-YIG nuclease family protein [Candidatus Bathyarchaeota archaeon]
MVTRGSYCLCINVEKDKRIKVGALGRIDFPAGRYVYVGSALNSLIPRLGRHLRTSRGEGRVTHWHIDYLLREPGVEIGAIYATDWVVRMECEIAEKIAERGEAVSHFGCSDCTCKSHLYRVKSFGFITETGLKKVDLSTFASSPSPQ